MSETNFEELLDQYGRVEFECGHEDDGSRVTARKWRASILAHVAGLQRELSEQAECHATRDAIELSLHHEVAELQQELEQAKRIHEHDHGCATCLQISKDYRSTVKACDEMEEELEQAKAREKAMVEVLTTISTLDPISNLRTAKVMAKAALSREGGQ